MEFHSKLQNLFPRKSSKPVHIYYIRPPLDCGDIIFEQTYKASFYRKLESTQYNAVLATTGAVPKNSKEEFYQELGFACLRQRRWSRKLC